MNPLIQGKSGTTPVMSRNAFSTNQGTNEDDSQSDPHPKAGVFGNQTMRNSGQKDRRDIVQIGEKVVSSHQLPIANLLFLLSLDVCHQKKIGY